MPIEAIHVATVMDTPLSCVEVEPLTLMRNFQQIKHLASLKRPTKDLVIFPEYAYTMQY